MVSGPRRAADQAAAAPHVAHRLEGGRRLVEASRSVQRVREQVPAAVGTHVVEPAPIDPAEEPGRLLELPHPVPGLPHHGALLILDVVGVAHLRRGLERVEQVREDLDGRGTAALHVIARHGDEHVRVAKRVGRGRVPAERLLVVLQRGVRRAAEDVRAPEQRVERRDVGILLADRREGLLEDVLGVLHAPTREEPFGAFEGALRLARRLVRPPPGDAAEGVERESESEQPGSVVHRDSSTTGPCVSHHASRRSALAAMSAGEPSTRGWTSPPVSCVSASAATRRSAGDVASA